MDNMRAKFQADINKYIEDIDQNKRFVALLREKLNSLQEESNNFGDASPRWKSKKSPVQDFGSTAIRKIWVNLKI